MMTSGHRRLLLGLALLVPLLFFWQRGLNEPDEGRYVEIAREMWTTGDYVIPRIKGIPHYAKPPLTYWVLALSLKAFGANEFAVRLPATLAAMLILLMIFDLGQRLSASRERGILAALALSVSFEFFALSRIITTDMLLVLFTTMSLWALLRADDATESKRLRWNLLFFIALGLGFLTKGPVVLGVVFSGMVAASLVASDWSIFRRRHHPLGLLVFSAIALPWYYIVASKEPGLYDFFFGSEVLDRVTTGRGRRKSYAYFLLVLPLAIIPFTPFVLMAAKRVWRQRSEVPVALVLGFVIGPFLLFSLASSKLWTYILPVIPALFLLMALGTRLELKRGFFVLWTLGLGLGLGADFLAEDQALQLNNNVGYRAVAASLAGPSYRGMRIPRSAEEQELEPRFSRGPGTRIATFRLRFTAAAFYLLGEKPDYLPIYGGDTLWEWESEERRSHLLDLDDLVRDLREPEAMIVLLKRKDIQDLETALGSKLSIVETFGDGEEAVVALSNA